MLNKKELNIAKNYLNGTLKCAERAVNSIERDGR